jgi:flagellar biosynthetic protein FliR
VGFALRLVFGALELGGQIIAMQMGLGFSVLVDPQNGAQVPLLSAFYSLLATLVFLALNGHLVLLQVLVQSFQTLPVATTGLLPTDLWELPNWGGEIFAGAVGIGLPIIASLAVVNLAFGVMTQAAPQLNLFAVGFPISLLLGLVIIILTLPTLVPQFSRLVESAFLTAQRLADLGT